MKEEKRRSLKLEKEDLYEMFGLTYNQQSVIAGILDIGYDLEAFEHNLFECIDLSILDRKNTIQSNDIGNLYIQQILELIVKPLKEMLIEHVIEQLIYYSVDEIDIENFKNEFEIEYDVSGDLNSFVYLKYDDTSIEVSVEKFSSYECEHLVEYLENTILDCMFPKGKK